MRSNFDFLKTDFPQIYESATRAEKLIYDEINRDTYRIFDLEVDNPTFAYELQDAIAFNVFFNRNTIVFCNKLN